MVAPSGHFSTTTSTSLQPAYPCTACPAPHCLFVRSDHGLLPSIITTHQTGTRPAGGSLQGSTTQREQGRCRCSARIACGILHSYIYTQSMAQIINGSFSAYLEYAHRFYLGRYPLCVLYATHFFLRLLGNSLG